MTFDLIGLPPTPEEIADFLADQSPDAYSPRRRPPARLAALRRALGASLDGRRPLRRHGRRQRRLPDPGSGPLPRLHHRFVQRRQALRPDAPRAPRRRHPRSQTAATENYAESVIATGFLALSRRYATAPFELWHLTLEDTIDTTGRAFLGLTLRCARCHDHKFDPVTQRDYYSLYGIFASTTFPYAGSEELHSKSFPRMNFVPVVPPEESKAKLEQYEKRLAELDREAKELESKSDPGIQEAAGRAPRRMVEARSAFAAARSSRLLRGERGKARRRAASETGRPGQPGRGRAPRRAAIRVPGGGTRPRRRAGPKAAGSQLADWLTNPAHPLTARVMVNRIWQYHFGRGIVATPSNFGIRGEPPTHPELLDWLAAKFVSRRLVDQEAASGDPAFRNLPALERDRFRQASLATLRTVWLWRFPRRRLAAESIRDAMLAVSGRLELDGRPASLPADRRVALDAAQPVQGGLSRATPQRVPDDPAPGEAPFPGDFRRARHQRLDRRPRAIDRAAASPVPSQQPVRA